MTESAVWEVPYLRLPLLVFLLLGPLGLLIFMFGSRKVCRFRASLSAAARRRRIAWRSILLLAILSPFILIGVAVTTQSELALAASFPALSIFHLGVPLFALTSSPFQCRRYEDGRFWIRGASREYLQSLQKELEAGNA
jgi:hypothetical protein